MASQVRPNNSRPLVFLSRLSRVGARLRGEGVYADLLARRFALALKRFGFEGGRHPPFDCTRFVPPRAASPQGELF